MVGSPDVDHPGEPFPQFAAVIRDIGREIGGTPVARTRTRSFSSPAPGCGNRSPLGFVEVSAFPEIGEGGGDQPPFMQILFREPPVVGHPERRKVVADPRRMRSPASFLKTGSASSSGVSAYLSATSSRTSRASSIMYSPRYRPRKLDPTSAQDTVPCEERAPEVVHLVSDVVDVIFADDLMAGELEDPGDGVPDGGAPAVTDVKRAGRIRRDELDVDGLSSPAFEEPNEAPFPGRP